MRRRRSATPEQLAAYLAGQGTPMSPPLTEIEAAEIIEVQVRVLNETDTGFLVTQAEIGEGNNVWVDKAQVEVKDRFAIGWEAVKMRRGYARKKGLA